MMDDELQDGQMGLDESSTPAEEPPPPEAHSAPRRPRTQWKAPKQEPGQNARADGGCARAQLGPDSQAGSSRPTSTQIPEGFDRIIHCSCAVCKDSSKDRLLHRITGSFPCS